VRIEQSTRDGCAIVALHGLLDLAAVPRVHQALLKRRAEQPLAVICDLAGLTALDSACASVFATVATHPTTDWPAAGLLLCAASPAVAAVLAGLGVPQFLPVHPSVEDAIRLAFARPPWLREELTLPAAPTAPAAARRFVRDVCQYWRLGADDADDPDDLEELLWLEELVEQAELVASELVTNAVLHARSQLRLRVEWRAGERLHLAVHDHGPWLLREVERDQLAEGGRGLQLVQRLATASGVTYPPEGGKIVWAVLTR